MVQDVVPAVGVELKEVFHDADLNFAARRGGILVQRGVHLPQAQDRERHSASKKKNGLKRLLHYSAPSPIIQITRLELHPRLLGHITYN